MKINKSKVLNILHNFVLGVGILACIFGILYVITLLVPSTSEKIDKTMAQVNETENELQTLPDNLIPDTNDLKVIATIPKNKDGEKWNGINSDVYVNVVVFNSTDKKVSSEVIKYTFKDKNNKTVGTPMKVQYDTNVQPNQKGTIVSQFNHYKSDKWVTVSAEVIDYKTAWFTW